MVELFYSKGINFFHVVVINGPTDQVKGERVYSGSQFGGIVQHVDNVLMAEA